MVRKQTAGRETRGEKKKNPDKANVSRLSNNYDRDAKPKFSPSTKTFEGVMQCHTAKTDTPGPNPGAPPLSLSVVGLYHSAAEGDLDLWASLFAIHLVLQCSVGMDSLCVFFSSTDACQRPGLALCRAGPNASIIAPRGKRGLYLSTAEWAKDYSGTPRGKTGPMKSRANHWTFYSKPRLRQRCEEGREEPNTPRSKHPPHSARFVNTSGQT